MVKQIIAVVVSLAVFMLMVVLADVVLHAMHSPSSPFSNSNAGAAKAFVSSLGIGLWLLYSAMHAIGAVGAGAVLRVVGGAYHRLHATVLGIVVALLEGLNGFGNGHPMWQPILAIILALPCVFLGHIIMHKLKQKA